MRARRRWTRSTAAAVLIEHGLDSEDSMTGLAGGAVTRQDYTALTEEYRDGEQEDDGRGGCDQRTREESHEELPAQEERQ